MIVNLIKDLTINHLNQVWTTDVTYIQTINEGTFFLISYLDYYSKKVIAWGLFENQKTDKLLSVLKETIKKEKLYQMKLYAYEDAYNAIYEYIVVFYNPIRILSSIWYLSPDNFENTIKINQNPL